MNLGALRSADYRLYFLGNVFALNGMWLCRVTIAWLAWTQTERASFVGLVAFLAFAPTLVSGPFFGVLADRVALRRAAFLTQSGLALSASALLLAAAFAKLSPALLAALALAFGIVISAHHPVRLALAPSLVPRSAIASAVALGSLNFNMARLTGPAIGGLVISAFGPTSALAIAVLCFMPNLTLIPRLDPRTDGTPPARTSILAALGEGIGHAVRTPLIRTAMLMIGFFSLVARGLLEILPVLADGVYARGAAGLGALTAAAGAGALAAAAIITFSPGQRPGRLPLKSRIAAPAGILLVAALAWSPSWPLALALTAAIGLCGTLVGVGLQSSVQLVLPDAYRARVMSLWTMLAVGNAALGAIALGALIDLLGVTTALTLAALAGLAALLPLLASPLAEAAQARTSPIADAPEAPLPISVADAGVPTPDADPGMTLTRDIVLQALRGVSLPDNRGNIVDADLVRALTVEGSVVRFVLEVDPAEGAALEPVRAAAQEAVERLPGVTSVAALLTAHGPASKKPDPPSLKIGRHPTPQSGPAPVPGVKHIILVGSGKGGVGKSTLSANLAVALAQEGMRVGLLDADFYGPSQPRMMGVSDRPQSPDGKIIIPLQAHGVTVMSIGLMLQEGQAVVWRGPMLMGGLQQLMTQVAWGDLDVLLLDLPPGTGDIQLTLAQKFAVTGAVVVSTPQDVALLDARKAMDMFAKTHVPVLGLVENMSRYICPNCGHEEHIFGEGGVRAEADRLGLPFLGDVPLDVGIRLSGDAGTPITALDPDAPQSRAFRAIALRLIEASFGHSP